MLEISSPPGFDSPDRPPHKVRNRVMPLLSPLPLPFPLPPHELKCLPRLSFPATLLMYVLLFVPRKVSKDQLNLRQSFFLGCEMLGLSLLNPVVLVLVFVLVIICRYNRKRSRMVSLINRIPGPPSLPIIGNAIEINVEHDGMFTVFPHCQHTHRLHLTTVEYISKSTCTNTLQLKKYRTPTR